MNIQWNDNRAQPEELNFDYYLQVCLCDDGTGEWTWFIEADDFLRLQGPRFWHAANARSDCERVVTELAPLLTAEMRYSKFHEGDKPAWYGEEAPNV